MARNFESVFLVATWTQMQRPISSWLGFYRLIGCQTALRDLIECTVLRNFVATVRTEAFVAVQQREALDTETVARRGGDIFQEIHCSP